MNQKTKEIVTRINKDPKRFNYLAPREGSRGNTINLSKRYSMRG